LHWILNIQPILHPNTAGNGAILEILSQLIMPQFCRNIITLIQSTVN